MVAQILEETRMSEKKQRRSWTPDEKTEIVSLTDADPRLSRRWQA